MTNKKTAAYLCTGLLLLSTTGCGNSNAAQDVTIADSINYNDIIDTETEGNNNSRESDSQSSKESINNQSHDSVENDDNQENNQEDLVQQSNSTQSQSDDAQPQSDSSTSQADSKLDGNIESIGDNSVTISKTLHPSENLAVSSDELVTVYFSEETEFEVWTVKNGGVNGDADTEKRQGAFSDLNLGASIRMTGSYDGSDFNAKYVMIYNFV